MARVHGGSVLRRRGPVSGMVPGRAGPPVGSRSELEPVAVCNSLTRLLVHQGVDVEGCTTPEAFMVLARARNHRALLVDRNLTVCDGTDLIRDLRDEDDLRPIGLMSPNITTGHGDQLALEAGAEVFIDKTLDDTKPFVAAEPAPVSATWDVTFRILASANRVTG